MTVKSNIQTRAELDTAKAAEEHKIQEAAIDKELGIPRTMTATEGRAGQPVKDPSAIDPPTEEEAPEPICKLQPGTLKSIDIKAYEMEARPGETLVRVTVEVSGQKPVSKQVPIANHMFRGYFQSIWKSLGEDFRRSFG